MRKMTGIQMCIRDRLIADGGKVILCSHLGKVKTEEDKQTKTLAPVAKRLTELLGQEVKFVPSLEVVDDTVKAVSYTHLIMSTAFIFAGFSVTCSGMFQAVGKGVYSMIVSMARQLFVILPVAYFLSKAMNLSLIHI